MERLKTFLQLPTNFGPPRTSGSPSNRLSNDAFHTILLNSSCDDESSATTLGQQLLSSYTPTHCCISALPHGTINLHRPAAHDVVAPDENVVASDDRRKFQFSTNFPLRARRKSSFRRNDVT